MPTPIIRPPTNKTLKKIKQELHANGRSVELNLGGGDYGYLGLILDDQEWAGISPIQFQVPNYPQHLVILPDTTQVGALALQEQHNKEKWVYYECKNVEKAPQWHIQDAIEDKCLESLIDEDTQLI